MNATEDDLLLATTAGCCTTTAIAAENNNATQMISNSTEAPAEICREQEYYSFNYAVVGTFFQSIIFVVGVLGNVLVCVVVRRTRSMHSTTNCYLVSLAVADTITLVSSVPQEVLSYHILGDQWVWGSLGCTLMIYLQYLGIDASALSLTAFTVERYIAICHPMKSKSICTLSRAKKIICACWVFAIFYCSPWFLLTTTKTVCVQGIGNITSCVFSLQRNSTEYLILFFTDIVLFYVVPLLLSVVLYSLIARMLLANCRNKFPCSSGTSSNGPSNGTSATALSVSEAAAKSNQSRVQVVKMLACVVCIFATLWVPYRGLLVFNSFATMNERPPYLDLWYLMFAKTCIYMNCAINPILYNAMSDKFRKAFRRLLSCGIVRSDSHIQRYRFHPVRSTLLNSSMYGGADTRASPATTTTTTTTDARYLRGQQQLHSFDLQHQQQRKTPTPSGGSSSGLTSPHTFKTRAHLEPPMGLPSASSSPGVSPRRPLLSSMEQCCSSAENTPTRAPPSGTIIRASGKSNSPGVATGSSCETFL